MRTFKLGLATLATTAAVLVPAGLATAGSLVDVDACTAQGSCSPVTSIPAAVNFCPGVNVNGLLALQKGQSIECKANGGYFKKN